MKKYTKVLALALALTMMLSMSVFAGTIDKVDNRAGYTETVTVTAPDGGSVAEKDKIKVTYDGNTANAMYLLLILEAGKSIPDKDNILYVNQETADANGDVTFGGGEYPVYPKDIVNSTIWLAGGDFAQGVDPLGLTAVADITPKGPSFIWGDADQTQSVNIMDALAILWHVDPSVVYELTAVGAQAADVDGMPGVSIMDALNVFWFIDPSTGVTKFPVE